MLSALNETQVLTSVHLHVVGFTVKYAGVKVCALCKMFDKTHQRDFIKNCDMVEMHAMKVTARPGQ